MSCLVERDGALLVVGHHFGLFLQSSDYSVHGVEEILLAHGLLVVTCCDEGGLVAYVCYVGT